MTTGTGRRAIQNNEESLETVAKWKKQTSVHDVPTGPHEPTSTVLSAEEETIIVAFRCYTLLPLDDCLYALQPTIPRLTRSSLNRCLQLRGISRLPDVTSDQPAKKKFNSEFRHKCLLAHWLLSLANAREKIEVSRSCYDEDRPDSAIVQKVPISLTEHCGASDSPT